MASGHEVLQEPHKRAESSGGYGESSKGGREREQQALREQLADHAGAAGAERNADSDFTLAGQRRASIIFETLAQAINKIRPKARNTGMTPAAFERSHGMSVARETMKTRIGRRPGFGRPNLMSA